MRRTASSVAGSIVFLYRNGLTASEVAEATGVSASTVRRYLHAAGVPLRKTSPPRGAAVRVEIDRVIALCRSGMPPSRIAEVMGVDSIAALADPPRATGMAAPPPGRPNAQVSDDVILRLHGEGWSARQIGDRVGLGKDTVHSRLRRHRVSGRPAFSPRTRLDVELMTRLYLDGLTTDEVGARLGVRGTTVAKHLRRAGVQTRPGGPRMAVSDELIAELRRQGLTGRQIGERVGMSKDGVYTRLRKMRQAHDE